MVERYNLYGYWRISVRLLESSDSPILAIFTMGTFKLYAKASEALHVRPSELLKGFNAVVPEQPTKSRLVQKPGASLSKLEQRFTSSFANEDESLERHPLRALATKSIFLRLPRQHAHTPRKLLPKFGAGSGCLVSRTIAYAGRGNGVPLLIYRMSEKFGRVMKAFYPATWIIETDVQIIAVPACGRYLIPSCTPVNHQPRAIKHRRCYNIEKIVCFVELPNSEKLLY